MEAKNPNSTNSKISHLNPALQKNITDKMLLLQKETEEKLHQSLNNKEINKSKGLDDTVRALVSQDKNRFRFDGFDLDLTYVTSRVIGMGFPSESLAGLYRNNLKTVIQFFENRHPRHYKVFNLCNELNYPEGTFFKQGRYPFKDHEAPPLNLIYPFCQDAATFLDSDPENVVAIHCLAGKGRTGLFISCLLLYLEEFTNPQDALLYYGLMRVSNGKGVTVPSQIRYVYYFSEILKKKITRKLIYKSFYIRCIKFITVPNFSTFGNSCSPNFSIENTDEDTKETKKYRWIDKNSKQKYSSDLSVITFNLEKPFKVKGDVRVCFEQLGTFSDEKMCKFWFNTNYIPEDGIYRFDKKMIDLACKDKTNKHFKPNFLIEVHCVES